MVSRRVFERCCHGLVLSAAVAFALWASGVDGAVAYNTATPHTPPYSKYKYIPVGSSYNSFAPVARPSDPSSGPSSGLSGVTSGMSGLAPSELILTVLRTALDVVRNINKQRGKSRQGLTKKGPNAVSSGREVSNATEVGRGFYDEYDDHHHDTTTTTAKPMKQGRYTDPWAGYYDWIINEGSFKFWSVFQLFTAALLLYACLSAIYYAKFNPIIPDYDREYDDYFLERTVGRRARSLDATALPSGLSWINPITFQFILDAIAKRYE